MHKFNLILAMKLYDGKPLSREAIDQRLSIWNEKSAVAGSIRNILSITNAENNYQNSRLNTSQDNQLQPNMSKT